MESKALIVCFLTLCLPGGLTARNKTDTLVMTNGDRLTCEIEKLERGVLYAGFDYVDGTVSLQWSKVARVESSQLFIVHTQDGSIYEGTLRTTGTPAEQPVRIEVLDASQNVLPLEPAKVVEMAQTSESLWKRFSGNIDTGLIFTKGNSTTQYNFGADFRVRGEYWRLAADFASSFSKSSGVAAATRNQPRIWARRLIGEKRKWYYSGGLELLQSSQQSIDLQTTLSAGVGRFLKDTNSTRIAVTVGSAGQRTRYAPSDGTQTRTNAFAGMLNTDLHLFRFKKTALDFTASVLPVLTEVGRVRTYINSAYSIQVFSNFWFKMSFYGNWDNRPPATFSGSDYGVSSGISYSFN